MRAKIRGKYWKILRDRLPPDKDGLCVRDKRLITVRPSLRGERELDVLIHEMLHACMWDLDEEAVTEMASDIAHVLWRIGYRIEK